ncbi:hypothetical protein [Gracilibacillus salinarum]|uniref:Uncharacterized protein n=1 Tax=Gracilibacillus salinarum TaxID=2932255 RepID=A0ABY4GKY5_9BACI|nr:hypothetical protein [Gracilibacillus salinarum]UOQ84620.1 hypothetical protein MUN87_18455 [Gracilibacillus salinarum]
MKKSIILFFVYSILLITFSACGTKSDSEPIFQSSNIEINDVQNTDSGNSNSSYSIIGNFVSSVY